METIGRYRVLSEVARGGIGAVYRAVAPDGRTVAIKLLLAGARANQNQRSRFEGEARALERVRHPGVVSLLEAGEHQGTPFLALEWVEGETLAARLARQGPLAIDEAVELVEGLAGALAHCHASGVLHRDLKPENVLVRADSGQPCLTDFGLARELEPGAGAGLTATGCWLGTPGWWPPEQARGELARIGPASDVYGLGALLFGLLTGRPPQEGSDLRALLDAAGRPPVPPSRHRGDVPRWLDELVLSTLDPDPIRRPPGAERLAALLRVGGRTGRRRWPVALGAALALLLCAGGWVAWGERRRRASRAALDEAAALGSAGDGQGELAALDRAVALDPSVRALVSRGLARAARLDREGAARDLEAALALGEPRSAWTWLLAGRLDQLRGAPAEARTDYDCALELAPDLVPALAFRGAVRFELGDLQGALGDLDRALLLGGERVGLLHDRAMVKNRLGDHQGARIDCDRAIALEPRDPQLWNVRGQASRRLGDLRGALAAYDRALELDPRFVPALGNRSNLRHRLKDLEGALADADRLIELAPDALGHACRSLLRWAKGDAQGARDDLDRAVELAPRDPAIVVERGKLRAVMGDVTGALEDIERALQLDRDCADALVYRGKLRLQAGRLEEGLVDVERALAISPRHPEALITRCSARSMLGDPDGALADLDLALELAPDAEWAEEARRERWKLVNAPRR